MHVAHERAPSGLPKAQTATYGYGTKRMNDAGVSPLSKDAPAGFLRGVLAPGEIREGAKHGPNERRSGAAVADEELVKRLVRDVAEWNAWREANPDAGVDLSRADLRGAILSGAFLLGADLRGADLSGAILGEADLLGANLRGAILGDADLRDAILTGADLCDANLSDAILHYTNLSHAILRYTNLSDARLFETIFGNVDLTSVIGLGTCEHHGPSIVDHRTLQKSGTLPIAFLRGVGLPDNLIDYLPSLLNQAIQHYSCFISHSAKDQEFAERIYADLQNNGVRCWFAPHDLPIGGKILEGLDEAIRLKDKVLLILSKHSIKSNWVEKEVKKALEEEDMRKPKQTVLFPIRLDDAVIKTKEAWAGLVRRDRNIGDFRRWKDHDAYKQSFARVVRDLKVVPSAK